MKKISFQKNYNYGMKAPLKSHTCIFFEIIFFFISKKMLDQVHFQKNLQRLDQTQSHCIEVAQGGISSRAIHNHTQF